MNIKTVITILIMIIGMIACGDVTPTSPDKNLNEPEELTKECDAINKALLASDVVLLKSLINPKNLSFYESAIESNPSKLAGFAEVFKTRKLISIDDVYAVYEITYNNKYYEISLTKNESGKWQLSDF